MDANIKYCSKCGMGKPNTEEYYSLRSDTKKLNTQCKICKSKKRQEHYIANKEHALKLNKEWKAVNKERIKSVHIEYYSVNRDSIREKNRISYYETIEYQKERGLNYRSNHKKQLSLVRKKRHTLCKHKENVQASQWYVNNKEKHLNDGRIWRKNNPESVRSLMEAYRSRKMAAGGTFRKRDVIRLFNRQLGLCIYCNEVLPNNYHIDHVVPLSRGGNNYCGNIALACPSCNSSKGNKYIFEWKRFKQI